jgi:type IV pilus assembly protein PilQ
MIQTKTIFGFITTAIAGAALAQPFLGTSVFAAEVSNINYVSENDQDSVLIQGEGLSGFTREQKNNPPQLVLTFKGATLSEQAMKKLGTDGQVIQVSAYPVSGAVSGTAEARVVIDFKKNTTSSISQNGNKILIKMSANPVSASIDSVKTSVSSAAPVGESIAQVEPGTTESNVPSDPVNSAAADSGTTATLTTPVAAPQTTLDQAMHASTNTEKFTGSPITLNLKDADVHDVLRLIGETSGFNIIINPAVSGKLTLALDHVPWDQALEVVLTTLKLGAERNASVLRILPREMLLAEKQQDIDTKRLADASAPRVTRIFPISYADLTQLSTLLTSFANSSSTGPAAVGTRSTILVDATTQSLVVRDTAENVEKIRKMIELLDVQTPQVMIEGKVIEATSSTSKTLNGTFGIGSPHYGFAFNGQQGLAGFPTIVDPLGSALTGSFAGADIFSIAQRAITVRASLDALESQNKIKVVSSPKTVVLSGKSAAITQSQSTGVLLVTPGTSTSPATQQIITIQANTKLNVTPRVTNDGSILMKLDLTHDVLNTTNPNAPVAEPRQMTTEVVVGSGDTLVIGGILSNEETTFEGGVPFLRNIPLIGWFFGQKNALATKTELMFFVTPKIINQKKSGLSMDAESAAKPETTHF